MKWSEKAFSTVSFVAFEWTSLVIAAFFLCNGTSNILVNLWIKFILRAYRGRCQLGARSWERKRTFVILQLESLTQCVDRYAFVTADVLGTLVINHITKRQLLYTKNSFRFVMWRHKSGIGPSCTRAGYFRELLQGRFKGLYYQYFKSVPLLRLIYKLRDPFFFCVRAFLGLESSEGQ